MSLPIVAANSTVKRSFNTTRFTTAVPYTLAGSPSMHARVDGNAAEITTGFTLTADFDSKTGENQWVLDLSASASYTAGSVVEVFIAAGTVDSVSVVGLKVYEFQIGTTGSLDQSITRTLTALPNATAGAAGGVLIAGSNAATTFATLTVTGAVAFQSTFAVSSTVTYNAFTITNAMTVSGAMTLTGAVTASNASNNIVGIDVAKISGDGPAADALEAILDTTGGVQVTIGSLIVTGGTSLGNTAGVGLTIQSSNPGSSALSVENLSGNTISVTGPVAFGSTFAITGNLTAANLTNARIGYLDNINNATLAAAVFPTDPADESLIIAATDAIMTRIGSPVGASISADIAAKPTAAQIATAVWTDTTASDFTTASSPGKIIVTQLGGAFTTNASSIFSTAALANAPSGSLTVSAIWSEALPGAYAAGSAGKLLSTAGAASDPLLNTVPGTYASGTAGHALGRIGSAQIHVSSTVAENGSTDLVYRGGSYLAADGVALDFTNVGAAWPDLTGATIRFYVTGDAAANETGSPFTGSVVTAASPGQKVRLELTAGQTTALTIEAHPLLVVATLSNSHVIPLFRGLMPVVNLP